MDEEFSTTPFRVGMRLLVPGIAYQVTVAFRDHGGMLHERGECWKFEGWSCRKLHRGNSSPTDLIIRIVNAEGIVHHFQMKWHENEQAKILSNFERYVRGVFPKTLSILEKIGPEANDAFKRVSNLIEPIPEDGEEFVAKVIDAHSSSRIADERSGWVGNPYERIGNDIRCLEHNILRVVAEIGM